MKINGQEVEILRQPQIKGRDMWYAVDKDGTPLTPIRKSRGVVRREVRQKLNKS